MDMSKEGIKSRPYELVELCSPGVLSKARETKAQSIFHDSRDTHLWLASLCTRFTLRKEKDELWNQQNSTMGSLEKDSSRHAHLRPVRAGLPQDVRSINACIHNNNPSAP
jgi:hypothetical protein